MRRYGTGLPLISIVIKRLNRDETGLRKLNLRYPLLEVLSVHVPTPTGLSYKGAFLPFLGTPGRVSGAGRRQHKAGGSPLCPCHRCWGWLLELAAGVSASHAVLLGPLLALLLPGRHSLLPGAEGVRAGHRGWLGSWEGGRLWEWGSSWATR